MSNPKYFKVNLNDYIKVRLTDYGKKIREAGYYKYGLQPPPLELDKDGYATFQLHVFFHQFGPSLGMAGPTPCAINVLIQGEE